MGCQGSCFPNILGMDSLQTLSAYNNGVYQRMSPPPFQRRGRVKISLREKKESSVHWVRYTNEDGIPYYFDTTTGTSQWTQPSSPVVVGNSVGRMEKSLREVFNESQEDLRDRMHDTEWVRFVDESTKVEYFKNIRTGRTTWERPNHFATNEEDLYSFQRAKQQYLPTESPISPKFHDSVSSPIPFSAFTSWSSYQGEHQ
mmetsp:Transcript_12729/g.17777  ORF Transcript_12729/g.17777 Transcript_12729/m.17777 type:complete len:200 (+) Transcript_12729:223-822(+)